MCPHRGPHPHHHCTALRDLSFHGFDQNEIRPPTCWFGPRLWPSPPTRSYGVKPTHLQTRSAGRGRLHRQIRDGAAGYASRAMALNELSQTGWGALQTA